MTSTNTSILLISNPKFNKMAKCGFILSNQDVFNYLPNGNFATLMIARHHLRKNYRRFGTEGNITLLKSVVDFKQLMLIIPSGFIDSYPDGKWKKFIFEHFKKDMKICLSHFKPIRVE